MIAVREGTFQVQTTARPKLVVSADGRGVVSHAGSRLLVDLADRTTLTGQLGEALTQLGRPRTVHGPGRVLVDLAVAVADGAECISDIAVLAEDPFEIQAERIKDLPVEMTIVDGEILYRGAEA